MRNNTHEVKALAAAYTLLGAALATLYGKGFLGKKNEVTQATTERITAAVTLRLAQDFEPGGAMRLQLNKIVRDEITAENALHVIEEDAAAAEAENALFAHIEEDAAAAEAENALFAQVRLILADTAAQLQALTAADAANSAAVVDEVEHEHV